MFKYNSLPQSYHKNMSYIAIMVVTPLETNLARDIQTADIARPSPSLLQATPQPSLSEAVFTLFGV